MGELPPNKNCGKEDCRRPTYCSCECGWAASSFSGGAQLKFSKKGEQKTTATGTCHSCMTGRSLKSKQQS